MKTVIKNISELIQTETTPKKWVAGKDMSHISTIKDAFIEVEEGIITSFGSMEDWNGIEDWNNTDIIDAEGGMVFPTYCDSHTHLVFAASREGEFVDRINGLSYAEIAERGGGILNSADKLQNASEDELFEDALARLNELVQMGTGAIEIKSGYGLTLDAELKMLRVIKKLKDNSPVTIKATFLGAHAIPEEFKNNRKVYIDLVINEMLPAIQKENLADYIDVFCEKNYYTPDETNLILSEGKKIGLIPKIHVNQFNAIGGVQVGVEHNALSVDHLEVMRPEDIAILKGTDTMPTALPSCSFFLGIPYAPAKEIIEAGLPLALASDYNPGSTPSGNMNFVVSLGCIKMGLSPEQAINAATINTAYAMELSEEMGSIAIGKKGNVFITKNIPSYSFLPYSFCIQEHSQ